MQKVIKSYQLSTPIVLQFVLNPKQTNYARFYWREYEFLQVSAKWNCWKSVTDGFLLSLLCLPFLMLLWTCQGLVRWSSSGSYTSVKTTKNIFFQVRVHIDRCNLTDLFVRISKFYCVKLILQNMTMINAKERTEVVLFLEE